jgi:uncharacterized protein (TIGR03067 family)
MFSTLLALSVAAPAVKDKAPDPAAEIIGLWELERTDGGSGNAPKNRAAPLRYRFDKGGTYTVLEGDQELGPARAVKIDGAARLAALDFSVSKDSSPLVLGIFKIEGDKLTICKAYPGKERPTKFEGTTGTEDYHYLMVFRRVKAKD